MCSIGLKYWLYWIKDSKTSDFRGQKNGNQYYVVARCLAILSLAVMGEADHILMNLEFQGNGWKTEYFLKTCFTKNYG